MKMGIGHISKLLLIFCFVVICGCVDIIEFDIERSGKQLVIYSKFTNSGSSHLLRLGFTSPEVEETIPETGARVMIFNIDGESEEFIDMGDGYYKLCGDQIKGVKGQSYYVEIILENGNTYQSKPEKMPELIGEEETFHEIAQIETFGSQGVLINKTVVQIYTNTQLPVSQDPVYLKWDIEELYVFAEAKLPLNRFPFWSPKNCYISVFSDPQSIRLFDTENIEISSLNNQLRLERDIDHTFFDPHYFNVIQSSITKDAYNYWKQIDDIANRKGSIFDTPPASVKGNWYNVNNESEEVLGYFEVAVTDTTRTFVNRGDVTFVIEEPCEVNSNVYRVPYNCVPCLVDQNILDEECINCLTIKNSSVDRPTYFD